MVFQQDSANPKLIYTALPESVQARARVGAHPDVTTEWCLYNPTKYAINVFLRGIFRDVHMGTVTNLKAKVTQPWLKEFLEEDPEAFLGDGFRHAEAGEIFIEEYLEVEREGESLAPISGHPMNIITETDRTIEKWHVRISHNRADFARFFKDYSSFKEFMKLLEGNMTKSIKRSLAVIAKSALTADPSMVMIDDRDIARIFGRPWNWTQEQDSVTRTTMVPASPLAKKYNELMKKLIQKYASKARTLWKNICWYNPYNFAFDNTHYEESRKYFIYNQTKESQGSSLETVASNKDFAKIQLQQTYTNAHKTDGEDGGGVTTSRLVDLHRNDCLFALFDALSKALNILTTEESPEFWLGNDPTKQIDPKFLQRLSAQGLVGEAVSQTQPSDFYGYKDITSASSDDGFEVTASPDTLVLLLNPEDYDDLNKGIARRGQMDMRAVNLNMLREQVQNIYPMRGMKPGHARLIDKRAFRIKNYFQLTDVQTPMEKIHWRYKMFYQFAVTMFKNFAGVLFVPTPHFVASPRFYDKFGLIGATAEHPQEPVVPKSKDAS